MVGLNAHQQTVLQQLGMIEQIGQQADEAQDEQLIEMARAFLQIDAALRDVSGKGAGAEVLGSIGEAQATVIRETRHGLAQVRDVLVDFVTAEFDGGKLEGLAQNLRNLRGGLTMVGQDRPANVLLACAVFVESVLIEADSLPNALVLDDLADAITSIDYYLERLLESATDPYMQMIEVAESSVAKLGYDVERVLAMSRGPLLPVAPGQAPPVEIAAATDAPAPSVDAHGETQTATREHSSADVSVEAQGDASLTEPLRQDRKSVV